jgi:hypothetical protein
VTADDRRIPRWAWALVRLAVAAAVVAWLAHALRLEHLSRAAANWPLLVAAVAAIVAGIFLTSIRWGILLAAQDIHLGLVDRFVLMMTGFFFTTIAPGGIGGDAVKAFYVARGREKKAAAATTVFLDRFLGLWTLLLVSCVVVAVRFQDLWHRELAGLGWFGLPGGRVLVLAIGLCALALLLVALAATSKRLRRSTLLKRASRFVPFRRTLLRVYDAVHLYGDRPDAVLRAAAISVVAQVPLFLVYWLYAVAIGAELEWWHCALIVPPAMVIRVLPLSPGGAGQGMAAMALLLPLVGVPVGQATLIGALGDAMFIVVYLIGGAFFLFGRASYREMRCVARSGGPEP